MLFIKANAFVSSCSLCKKLPTGVGSKQQSPGHVGKKLHVKYGKKLHVKYGKKLHVKYGKKLHVKYVKKLHVKYGKKLPCKLAHDVYAAVDGFSRYRYVDCSYN